MTAPYDPRALDELAQTLETTCVVTATTSTGVPLEVLDVDSLVLTMDEAWSPLAQVELTATSLDPALLDPRTGTRLSIALGYRYPGGTLDEHVVANLALAERSKTTAEGVCHLNALGDEMATQEWLPLGAPMAYAAGTSVVAVIASLLNVAVGRVPITSTGSPATISEPLTVGPGSRLWSILKALSDQADVWTYADPLGTWHVADRPTTTGVPTAHLITGPAGTVTVQETSVARADWGNAVELEYAGQTYSYAHEPMGTMGTDAVGVCAVNVKMNAPWPGTAAAQLAADAVLRRTLTRGSAEAITALAAWWVRPGDTITRDGGTRALVSRVRFTFPDSLMTVTTREVP